MFSWRALLAGILMLGLAAGLVWVISTSDDAPPNPVPTLAAAPGSTTTTAVPATVTIPAATSTTTVAGQVTTSGSPTQPPVVVALQAALDAWGQFAVTGQMADLGEHFVVGGPQRRLLRDESAAIRENPVGPPGYVVTASNIFSLSVTTDDVVLRADIEWAREGEESQKFLWDIQMRRIDGSWQLLTVEDVTEAG